MIGNVEAIVHESDGHVVLAGTDTDGFFGFAERFDVNATLDPTFGQHGRVALFFHDVSMHRGDGKYVFAGNNVGAVTLEPAGSCCGRAHPAPDRGGISAVAGNARASNLPSRFEHLGVMKERGSR